MNPNARTKLRKLLLHHEGLRKFPYTDITGHITIGVGRSLSTRGITEAEALTLLDDDMMWFTDKLNSTFPWFAKLDENRQLAIVDMAFNLGMNGLLEFKDMLFSISTQNWDMAAEQMLQSKWAIQVGERAIELANIIRTGECNAQ